MQFAEQRGPFERIFDQYRGRYHEAALRLEQERGGEALGALHHPDVGDLALVWGHERTNESDGAGLAKLIAWHPEVVADLPQRLARMKVKSGGDNRIVLEGDGA